MKHALLLIWLLAISGAVFSALATLIAHEKQVPDEKKAAQRTITTTDETTTCQNKPNDNNEDDTCRNGPQVFQDNDDNDTDDAICSNDDKECHSNPVHQQQKQHKRSFELGRVTTWPWKALAWALDAYDDLLQAWPAWTKIATAGVVSFLGDVLAQCIEHHSENKIQNERIQFHWYRSLTVATESVLVSGPILHFAYDAFADLVAHFGYGNVWADAILQVILDIFILDSFFAGTMMIVSGILQGHSGMDLQRELRNDLWAAVKVAWLSSLATSPLQFCNFSIIPVRFRVLITNLQDVIWNGAVSFMAHRSRPRIQQQPNAGVSGG